MKVALDVISGAVTRCRLKVFSLLNCIMFSMGKTTGVWNFLDLFFFVQRIPFVEDAIFRWWWTTAVK